MDNVFVVMEFFSMIQSYSDASKMADFHLDQELANLNERRLAHPRVPEYDQLDEVYRYVFVESAIDG